jgi:hypothetical protein
MTPNEQLLEKLDRIANALEGKKPKLGLHEVGSAKFIYISEESGSPWYFRRNDQNIPILETAFSGYLQKLEIAHKEYKGKTEPKLRAHFLAEQPYIIQSGLQTTFSRGFLLALNLLQTDQLRQLLTITVKIGTENAILCTTYCNHKFIRAEWDKTAPLDRIAEAINTRIHGEPPPNPTTNGIHPMTDYRRKLIDITEKAFYKLGWNAQTQKNYLQQQYPHAVSRLQLTDDELTNFTTELDKLANP